ncbi:hypothetical protein [Lysobacter sp. M2-1]|uniref:hypothetical protein n=1 Tax=Lysobacter sp. M2-1 TaxID=2916839 RepID=UPI001F58C03A|nr:hypothetical protein [Lysobacter sp. M2-1]
MSQAIDGLASEELLRRVIAVTTTTDMEALLATLPIVSENDSSFDATRAADTWNPGHLHWMPVGGDRGNAGRIKLANHPVNPLAERIVNGMEALIELHRTRELNLNSHAAPPESPRAAVGRYFGLPALDQIPKIEDKAERARLWGIAREIARGLRLKLSTVRIKGQPSFTIMIEDDGIGQSADMVHRTLLSLGSTTKGDKPYMIGLFGQGGSSAFSISRYSWVLSRRAPEALGDRKDGLGWSVIKQVFPRGRRDDYFAYLAGAPDGRVLAFEAAAADAVGMAHGTRFAHIGCDFQGVGGSSVTRNLFPALNHVLFNPMLPYELYAGRDTADPMWGNAYRLSNVKLRNSTAAVSLDKTFPPQQVTTR